MKIFDYDLKTVNYTVRSEKIKNKIKVALVTDLHSDPYGEKQGILLDALAAGEPDILLLSGDIFDIRKPKQNTENFLIGIRGKCPAFMVTGNHDHDFDGTGYIEEKLDNAGVKLLSFESVTLNVNGNNINVCGTRDIKGFRPAYKTWYPALDKLNGVSSNGLYTIFLSHRPEKIKKYLNRGFDLILCGHAHGGQWIIPGLLNGTYAPGQGIFPRYAGGRYDFDGCTMIVSRGLSKTTTKIPRIFNPPELVFIEISPENEQ